MNELEEEAKHLALELYNANLQADSCKKRLSQISLQINAIKKHESEAKQKESEAKRKEIEEKAVEPDRMDY